MTKRKAGKVRRLKAASLKRGVKIIAPVVLYLVQVGAGVKNLLPSQPHRVTVASANMSERLTVSATAVATVHRRGEPLTH
jgi:hypothetical protein